MYKTTSLTGLGDKDADLSNFANVWSQWDWRQTELQVSTVL